MRALPHCADVHVGARVDGIYGPGMPASNLALAGMAIAVAIKAQSGSCRACSCSAGGTAFLGVAQPALFGNALLLRRPLIGVITGGAAGGLVAGLTGFQVYALMSAGIAALPAWFGPDGLANPLRGAAVVVTAFVVSFAVTWLVGYEQPSKDDVAQLTQ